MSSDQANALIMYASDTDYNTVMANNHTRVSNGLLMGIAAIMLCVLFFVVVKAIRRD